MNGVLLLLEHPELPSCSSCQQWMYDDKWRQNKRGGKPVPRPPGVPTPCFKCPKILPDVEPRPENAIELSRRNHAAYAYYRMCLVDTTGLLPRDLLTVHNNALIRRAEDLAARAQAQAGAMLMQAMVAGS